MDTIQRFLFEQNDVRGEIVHLQQSFQTIMQQHAYPKVLQSLLGETLVVAVLLTNTIKFKGQLTIQFQSDGPIKTIVAKCTDENHIKGFISWDRSIVEADLLAELGQGQLVITITPDQHEPYQSIVPLAGQGVSEAIECYFAQSEQLSTKLWCAVGENKCSGMLLQLVPSTHGSSTPVQRENFWEHATQLGQTITTNELLELPNPEILHRLFHQEDVRVFAEQSVKFFCNCSLAKMQNSLRMLGRDEANAILKTSREIEVKCEYCSNSYGFTQADVDELFNKYL